jgi:predicted nucleic acid-binding protein
MPGSDFVDSNIWLYALVRDSDQHGQVVGRRLTILHPLRG